jgi:hypothetical protein
MNENKIGSLDHQHHSIFCKIRTPLFIRILLILFNMFVSWVFFAYAFANEFTSGAPIELIFSWLMYASKLRDLVPNVIVPDFLEFGSFFILHFLYLASLCVITTFFIRVIKSPMIRKLSSLLVPIAVHLSAPVLFFIIYRNVRSGLIRDPLGSLMAVGWVISFRTLDWWLAQKARRKTK